MSKIFDRVKVTVGSTGTGPITLGAAETTFRTFAQAGAVDGDEVEYAIEDGSNWEVGRGIYSATGPTLTRTPSVSSSGVGVALAITLAARVLSVVTTRYLEEFNKITVTGGVGGRPTNSLNLPIAKARRAWTIIPEHCSAQALTAATATAVVTLRKVTEANVDTAIGTFTWVAAGRIPTISITSGEVGANDVVYLAFPASADATLANIAFTVGE